MFFTVLALLDYFAALALDRQATFAYVFFSMITLAIDFLFWAVKLIGGLLIYPLAKVGLLPDFKLLPILKIGWHMLISFFGLFVMFCVNILTEVSSIVFDFICLVLNIIPGVEIPSDATSITAGYLAAGWIDKLDLPWLRKIIGEANYAKMLDGIKNWLNKLVLFKLDWLNKVGETLGFWLMNQVPTPQEILWVDIFGLDKVPQWFANATIAITNYGDFIVTGTGQPAWDIHYDPSQQQYVLG